jgi:DNA-binding NarL/FixJ family response regulator
MTRILIADDSPQVRQVLRSLVEQDREWKVCGEAIDGRDAIQKAKDTRPDLIVLDFRMPLMNGLDAARELAKAAPDALVLLCTGFLSLNLIDEAQRVGIRAAVSKSIATDIINGIRALLRHESYFSATA